VWLSERERGERERTGEREREGEQERERENGDAESVRVCTTVLPFGDSFRKQEVTILHNRERETVREGEKGRGGETAGARKREI